MMNYYYYSWIEYPQLHTCHGQVFNQKLALRSVIKGLFHKHQAKRCVLFVVPARTQGALCGPEAILPARSGCLALGVKGALTHNIEI